MKKNKEIPPNFLFKREKIKSNLLLSKLKYNYMKFFFIYSKLS